MPQTQSFPHFVSISTEVLKSVNPSNACRAQIRAVICTPTDQHRDMLPALLRNGRGNLPLYENRTEVEI